MMLALFIVAFELAEHSRWFAAGAVPALHAGQIPSHLAVAGGPVGAAALALAGGMLRGRGGSLEICVALGGVGPLRVYVAFLTNKSLDRLSPYPELMICYQGLVTNLGIEARQIASELGCSSWKDCSGSPVTAGLRVAPMT